MARQDSIEWHKECLAHSRAYLEERRAELKRKQDEVDRLVEEVLFYEQQIAEAERRGKTSFDAERFMRQRR